MTFISPFMHMTQYMFNTSGEFQQSDSHIPFFESAVMVPLPCVCLPALDLYLLLSEKGQASFCNLCIQVLETCSEAPLQTGRSEAKGPDMTPSGFLWRPLDSRRLCPISFLTWVSSWDSWMLTSFLGYPPVSCHCPSWRFISFAILDFLSSLVPESPRQGLLTSEVSPPDYVSHSLSLYMRNKKQSLFDSPPFYSFPSNHNETYFSLSL